MIEIERKFLVRADQEWKSLAQKSSRLQQGYLATGQTTVRIRIADEDAFLTIKGKSEGISRAEFEYSIPLEDAQTMLKSLCQTVISKTRYEVMEGQTLWTIDEFHGDHSGLVLAEVELEREEQEVTIPTWAGREVSDDLRYFNSNLVGAQTPPVQ